MKLSKEIEELERMLPNVSVKNTSISERGIDWHMDHSLTVINNVYDLLVKSNPKEYRWKFNFVRLVIFTKGSIPRGKARAPKAVNNKEEILISDVKDKLALAKTNLELLNSLPSGVFFNHPYFGNIKKDKTIKFLQMHTRHHYKIMKDILKTKG